MGAITTGVLLLIVGALAGLVAYRRQRPGTSEHIDRSEDIAQGCLRTSAEAVELLTGHEEGDALYDRWVRLHARLVELERQATDAADAAPDLDSQRSLDQLAAALISLRATLEADVRLRLDPDAEPSLVHATDDAVVVRCEDLTLTVRALEGSSG